MINWNIKLLRNVFSPRGVNARLAIITYHRVLDRPDPILSDEVDVELFEMQMEILSTYYNVIPLPEALDLMSKGALPRGAVSVTFDDGYADNLVNASPILKKWDITAVLFIATGYLDGGIMWNDVIIESLRAYQHSDIDLSSLGFGCHDLSTPDKKRKATFQLLEKIKYHDVNERIKLSMAVAGKADFSLPNNLMLTSDQVRELKNNNFIVGAHTHFHPILSETSLSEVENEIIKGKELLEGITGERVGLFAFPNGVPGKDYTQDHIDLLSRLDIDYAMTTSWGTASIKSDRMQIPRISPWDKTPVKFDLRITKSLFEKAYLSL